jgi:hypothetical protein
VGYVLADQAGLLPCRSLGTLTDFASLRHSTLFSLSG